MVCISLPSKCSRAISELQRVTCPAAHAGFHQRRAQLWGFKPFPQCHQQLNPSPRKSCLSLPLPRDWTLQSCQWFMAPRMPWGGWCCPSKPHNEEQWFLASLFHDLVQNEHFLRLCFLTNFYILIHNPESNFYTLQAISYVPCEFQALWGRDTKRRRYLCPIINHCKQHYILLSTTYLQTWCSPEAHCMIWNDFKAKHISVDTWGHTRMAKKISKLHFFTIGENLTTCEKTWKQRLRKELKDRCKEDKKEWMWSKTNAK